MMPNESHGFRLSVLNPGGRDPEQHFPEGAGEIGPQHAPVNFHSFAACTHGSFQRETKRALAAETPVLLLLRGDFRAAERALPELRKAGRTVAVALKETGLHQIAQQLRESGRLTRFARLLGQADGVLATTPESADLFRSFRPNDPERVAFIPTPYPVDDARWDFSRPWSERRGILVGTREWNVPSRNHLGALLLARTISERTGEPVTVFNYDGRTGAKRLAALEFPESQLHVTDRRFPYADYLREVSRHKIVLQLDSSFVPGQVAGDALLCRSVCLGGNGTIDRIAFADTCGAGRTIRDIELMAEKLLQEEAANASAVRAAQARAQENLNFALGAQRLRKFFVQISAG